MRLLSLPQTPLENNPPRHLIRSAEQIGAKFLGVLEGSSNDTVYAFQLNDESKIDCQYDGLDAIKISNDFNIEEQVSIKIYINSKTQYQTYNHNKDNFLPIIACPTSILDQNNSLKDINYIINCNNYNLRVHFYVLPCHSSNNESSEYIFLIPIIIMNYNDKYSIKYTTYYLYFIDRFINFTCPKITHNGISKIYKPYFILPRRVYPIWIYLKAVSLYDQGDITLQGVVDKIRQLFNIQKFNKSTLSRAIKSMRNDIIKNKIEQINTNATDTHDLILGREDSVTQDSVNAREKTISDAMAKPHALAETLMTFGHSVFHRGEIVSQKKLAASWFAKFSKHLFLTPLSSKPYAIS
jgi:hypothetical protein